MVSEEATLFFTGKISPKRKKELNENFENEVFFRGLNHHSQ
jgi:hypothetical protein